MTTKKVLELSTLYKQASSGAIQQWTVLVETQLVLETYDVGVVVTAYGQVGGQLQTTSDTVHEGKNRGRANETSPVEQAKLEAKSAWDKKLKQGYTESLTQAKTEDNVLEAIKPMLAKVYEDEIKKVMYPGFIQPKLDGFRCIAIVKNGKAKLYSRTQKEWTTMPHIVAAVEAIAKDCGHDFILDGELYNHDFKFDFNRIASITKRKDIHPDHKLVQYHVYDLPSSNGTFRVREAELSRLFLRLPEGIVPVVTQEVRSEEELNEKMEKAIGAGFEGLMYRHPDSKYEGKRSSGLLKVKTFRDDEFTAVDVEEGNGKLQGKAGAIWCVTKEGKRFKAKMQGSLSGLGEYLTNKDKYIGKKLTVKFFNYTPDCVPRFPVGIRFREDE